MALFKILKGSGNLPTTKTEGWAYVKKIDDEAAEFYVDYDNNTRLQVGKQYDTFEGASSSANGTTGLVPAPTKGQEGYYLRGDGVWFNLTGLDESVQNTFGALQKAWKEADTSLKNTLITLINGKAPTNHASSGISYGISTASLYGHAMASSTTPKASAATADVGSETAKFARGDHVHPLTVSNSWIAGTTAGPKMATTVNNVTGTAIAIPTATVSASGAVIVGDQTFGGIKRFSATDVSYTHELGAYYGYTNGYLIELGTAAAQTMIAIHISGNSYTASDLPIDSWFQFYDYDTSDGILQPSGINNGYPLGEMTVYRYNNKLYAWIAQGRSYQTLAFTVYTNAKHLTPVVTNAAKHTTNTSFVTTITPYLSLNTLNYNSYAPKLDGTGAVGTWGISISGNAATANALTVNAGDAGQPVYFTGGIPAAIDWHIGNQNVGEHNCNNVTYNFAGYYTSNGPATSLGPTTNDGALWAQAYNSSLVAQMAQDYRDGSLYVRGRNSGAWTAWQNVILGNGYQNVGPIKLTTGEGANNITTNYISAGRGYSTGSGLNGLKLVATEQADAISGIGQDCTGKAYELSIAAARDTSGQGYITFVGHKMDSLNTYSELGHFNFANSTFYVNGKIGVGTTSPEYAIHAVGDIYANGGWLRSSGNTGWYNQTYGGGWHMTDGTFIRSYDSKAVLVGNSIYVGTTAGNGTGLSLYSTQEPTTYGIHMSTTANYGKFGDVQSDWATYFNMNAVGQRGWIYRAGSTNVASISANGIGAFKGIIGETGHIVSPDGGRYTTTTGIVTGYLKITLPVSWTNAMIRFTVDIYDYTNDNTVTYIIGGYNYADSPGWYSTSAQCISKWGTTKSNLDVRFGHDGSKCAIYIGAANTSWSYPQVIIRDVLLGYGQADQIATWSKGWSIGFTTTLGSYIVVKTNTNVGYSVNYAGSAGSAATASALQGSASSGAVPLTDPGAGLVKYYYNVNEGLTGNMPTANNANGILYLNTHTGEYGYQLGFSSNGNIYYRYKNGSAFTSSTTWKTILDSGNYADHLDSRYVNVSGDTMSGKLQVNDVIVGYSYTKNGNNHAAFVFDKPSSNWTGIGACGDSDTIYFGACDSNGAWVTNYYQKWKFNGSLVVGGGSDNCNIVPWINNYSTIGTESLKWWKIYASTFYGDLSGTATYATNDGNGNNIASTYLPLSGGTITGNVTFSSNTSTTSPVEQRIVINGVSNDTTVANAPGIGFHIPNVTWGSLKFCSDGSFKFYDNSCSSFMPIYGSKVYGAVWNDYAEYRNQETNIEPGFVAYCDNNGKLKITTNRLQKFEGVVSDTFGFAIGENETNKTPIAVSGRVLVYTQEPREQFNSGDCVCAGLNGTVSKMTREEIIQYPDRIVGIVSEIPEYDTWGSGDVKVNGRIWIKVK